MHNAVLNIFLNIMVEISAFFKLVYTEKSAFYEQICISTWENVGKYAFLDKVI